MGLQTNKYGNKCVNHHHSIMLQQCQVRQFFWGGKRSLSLYPVFRVKRGNR